MITFDSVNRYLKWNTSGNSLTGSHTIAQGANRILIVAATCNADDANSIAATYNGVAMTKLVTGGPDIASGVRTVFFYMVNPPVGTANVVVSMGPNDRIAFVSASYFGVDQDNPFDDTSTNQTASGSSVTASIDTIRKNAWVLAAGLNSDFTATISGTAGVTNRVNLSGDTCNYGDTDGPIETPGTYTVIFNGTDSAVIAVVSMAPALSQGNGAAFLE